MATSGKTPFLKKSEIEELGFKLIIYPNWLMLAAIRAADGVLDTLREEETIASIAPKVPSFQEFFDLVGMQEVARTRRTLRRARGGARGIRRHTERRTGLPALGRDSSSLNCGNRHHDSSAGQ